MRITIIGGGPAGLYFAILMKKQYPDSVIDVHERNGRNDTFGWGVVFSGKTMDGLKEYDEPSHRTINDKFETWDFVDVVHRDEHIIVKGNYFNGISRLVMLNILQDRCQELGVTLHFNSEVNDLALAEDNDADLVVVADGVNSIIRRNYATHFKPNISTRTNKYIWYGTNQLFHGLTLTFRQNEHGIFAAHSYKFDKNTSTFVVECDEATWHNAGLNTMDEVASKAYIEKVFEKDLGGHPLLSNRSMWINFLLVKNEHWTFDNVVILGDACHTAHFSIGSGTKLALEDSIALFECFKQTTDVPTALANYERNRKPKADEYQEAAEHSLLMFENLKDIIHLSPMELAMKMMTRSKRVTPEKVRQRDPEFAKRYEEAFGKV
jgi:anthraniloyl-CoA monooxygenase